MIQTTLLIQSVAVSSFAIASLALRAAILEGGATLLLGVGLAGIILWRGE